MSKRLSDTLNADDAAPEPLQREVESSLGVQSVEIGMRLVQALADHAFDDPAPMLKTLAASAGMPPTKAHRYMVSLIRAQVAERDETTGRYRLGPMARLLGIRVIEGLDFVRIVTARMPAICDALGYSIALTIWTREGPAVIWVEEPRHRVTYGTRVGEIMPLLASATGRVFGAWLPGDMTAPLLDRPFHISGSDDIADVPTPDAIAQAFHEVREHGIGISKGGLTPTINGLSVPVFDYRGMLVAALSTLGQATELDPSPDGPVAQAMRAAAAALSSDLGYPGP